ncbi:MAG: 3-ketoacyl-ACP reductase [Paenibacillaceae bacterium]|jgi:NAD(P)-dependent dehydrogenase (short-subunit alcohol dehydrogenase family)|nr:3-ketoacyl-ACP reductase [Paenibacillaceae bacterium]
MDRRVALITGASRGIGLGIAAKLAGTGIAVAIVGTRPPEQVEEAVKSLEDSGSPVLYVQGNIACGEDRERIVSGCVERFGKIDILVNNAGVAPKERLDILSTTEESMDHVLGINLKGTFFLTQLVANRMAEWTAAGRLTEPRIITISSVSAYANSLNRAEYCLSKAALAMMTQLFAERLAEYGIHVYEIRPGIIATDMTSGVKEKYDAMIAGGLTPIKRWGYPEDVAKAVLAMCSELFAFSTGDVINVDGGFHIRRL